MKILLVTVIYKNNVKQIYNKYPQLSKLSYSEQKKIVDKEISIWASGWENALTKKKYEVFTIPVNVAHMQRKWAQENKTKYIDLHDIAYKQAKAFNPDIIWYDYFDIPLLNRLKSDIRSIKLIMGWTGSAIVDYNILKKTDLVLSCAPETVEKLNNAGIKTVHLNHAFNDEILSRLENSSQKKEFSFIFIGQIFRGNEFHNKRAQLLKALLKSTELQIYSPIYDYGIESALKSFTKKLVYTTLSPFEHIGWLEKHLDENKFFKELQKSKGTTLIPYEKEIRKKVLPPVYGTNMYSTISRAKVVLNIHADSSHRYASNMRLFETTGIGTCLLTDWKENLRYLFDDGNELISYRSTEECIEKVEWLLKNESEYIRIGKQAQIRTLKEHTYTQRVEELLMIINKNLK
jgi:spore maturation protein CgeB